MMGLKILAQRQPDGTITFPNGFLHSVGLDVGDELQIEIEGEKLILTPAEKVLKSPD